MATTHSISRISSSSRESSSDHLSSSGNLSGGKIAAVIIGTILAISLVCVLLLCPQRLFARWKKSRSRDSVLGSGEVRLKELTPPRPGRASGNDRSTKRADDSGSRRRRSEGVHDGSIQQHGNRIRVSGRSGSPVIVNNNIYINSGDYLQPIPSLNSPHNRDPATLGVRTPREAQGASKNRNSAFGLPPDNIIPPQRRGKDEPPASHPMATTSEQNAASNFWDVAGWAHGVTSGQATRSLGRCSAGSPVREARRNPGRRREQSFIRVRESDIPGAFPEEDNEFEERFQLVTAPARAHAPRVPSHGDNGFWVREAREDGHGRRQRREDRWQRQEREERRERDWLEREERRERDRTEREERRERSRIEREERRERREREEERKERRERDDRRERRYKSRTWRDV